MEKMTIEGKINLFWFCCKYCREDEYPEHENALKRHQAFLKKEGYKKIEEIAAEALKDTKIVFSFIKKQYTKNRKEAKIELTNTDTNIYSNKFSDLKKAYYRVADALIAHELNLI